MANLRMAPIMSMLNQPGRRQASPGFYRTTKQQFGDQSHLPPPPVSFAADHNYEVQLSRTVNADIAGTHKLRPCDHTVVRGDFAETIRDAISGARDLGVPA